MEDRDDGIGSEINTPGHVVRANEPFRNVQEIEIHEVGHLVASYPPLPSPTSPLSLPLGLPNTSTPIGPHRHHISRNIQAVSPIREVLSGTNASEDVSSTGGNVEGEVVDGIQYTKLDLAVKLRNKQLEFIQLKDENEQMSNLMEKLENENRHFRNQAAAAEVYAATLVEDKEKLKKALEEENLKFMECQHNLQIAVQKLALLENVSINIETDKIPDLETLRELQNENAELKETIEGLKFEMEIQKEGEKNANLWREKYSCILEKHGELTKELENKQAEIDRLKNNEDNEECNKIKKLYEESAEKVSQLQNQLVTVGKKMELFEQQEAKVTELEQELEKHEKAWEEERKHLQEEKFALTKRVEELTTANVALTTEKQSLLKADNKWLKDKILWQEKNKNLTAENVQLANELKKYQDLESELAQCLDELKKKDSLMEELNAKIAERNSDVNRFRDEIVYLRGQLNKKVMTEVELEKVRDDWNAERERLLAECKRLEEENRNTHSSLDQIAAEKHKNAELVALLEKREMELENTRSLLDDKRKRIEDLIEENAKVKGENIQLKSVVDEVSFKYHEFQNQAEVQYQADISQLNQIIREKDERLERLHDRIALYESYPGQSSKFASTTESTNSTYITVWDALPATIRAELSKLNEKYQDLTGLIHRMMLDPPRNLYTTPCRAVENKATDCSDLALSPHSSPRQTSGPTIFHPGPSIETSSESLNSTNHTELCENVQNALSVVLDSVRHAQIRGKLSPNIQQLLEHLLIDVQKSDSSSERIKEAVDHFFANLELALRRTLSASEDNRLKCEKLQKMYEKVKADYDSAREHFNSALSRCSLYEGNIDNLKLQLRCESKTVAELSGKLERARDEITNLNKQNGELVAALSNANLMLNHKTKLNCQAKGTIKCITNELEEARKTETLMDERVRSLGKEKEKIRCMLSQRELEIVKLECRLAEKTKECTERASEMQKAENKIDLLQKHNDFLKKKHDKRECFLEEMETILRAMKIRCDGLRETNQLRQSIIERLKKILVKLGFNLDESQLAESKKANASRSGKVKKCKTYARPPYLERLKFAKLVEQLKKNASRIEELEKCRNDNDMQILSWLNPDTNTNR